MEDAPEPVFLWNELMAMTAEDCEKRAVVIALSSVFDAIQALRADIRELGKQ